MTEKNDKFLSHLEWEGLQEEFEFSESISSENLPLDPTKVHISRDKNYKIVVHVTGKPNPDKKIDQYYQKKSGVILDPFEVSGTDYHGHVQYRLSDCYLGEIHTHCENDTEIIELDLTSFHIEKMVNTKEKRSWLTEWYINSTEKSLLLPRPTQRKYSSIYTRIRDIDGKKEQRFKGPENRVISVDYAFIKCEKYNFIIHKVPENFGPSGSHLLGIEYREDFGFIPEFAERESISEIISFIMGKHLLNIGYSIFDEHGHPITQVAINPWGRDDFDQWKSPSMPPIRITFGEPSENIETILPPLISKYLLLRDKLQLNEVLWRYWIAERMPLGTNIPIYVNGIEILINNWFKLNKSEARYVYLPKSEFDMLLEEIIPEIEKAFSGVKYKDKIVKKIQDSYKRYDSEKMEFFLNEIGMKIGKTEKDAIIARNKMIHGTIEDTPQEIRRMMILTGACQTFFNRILLTILGYSGKYVDYSMEGFPVKSISEVAGSEQ